MPQLPRILSAALLCCLAPLASSHTEPGETPAAAMDCGHLPPQAVQQLPEPIAQWTALHCRGPGQVLVQGEDWVWRYPGSFTQHVFIPAWMIPDTATAGTLRYFKSMTVEKLDEQRAAQMHEQLARDVSAYEFHAARGGQAKPSAAYTLMAQDDRGNAFAVHFMYRSEAEIWGVACVPECRSELLFHVSRRPE